MLRVVNDTVPVPKIIVCVKASLEGLELVETHFEAEQNDFSGVFLLY